MPSDSTVPHNSTESAELQLSRDALVAEERAFFILANCSGHDRFFKLSLSLKPFAVPEPSSNAVVELDDLELAVAPEGEGLFLRRWQSGASTGGATSGNRG